MDGDLTGVLLVRVWIEDDSDQFRARLTTSGVDEDARDADELLVAVASSPEAVSQAVRSWLDALLRDR